MMKEFWGFLLLSDLPNDALCGINFTVFGFGDSVYPKFNAMARKLHQRLIQLGANLFYNRGLGKYLFPAELNMLNKYISFYSFILLTFAFFHKGDEQHPIGYEGELMPWSAGLWDAFKIVFGAKFRDVAPLSNDKVSLPFKDAVGEIKYIAEVVNNSDTNDFEAKSTLEYLPRPHGNILSGKRALVCPILQNKRLTAADHFQDVRQIDFDTSESGGVKITL
jgi:hypothetical protein